MANKQVAKEIIPRPVLNTPTTPGVWIGSKPVMPVTQKKKFTLLNQAGEVVATLIDQALADTWVKEGKKGAAKVVEGVITPSF